MKKFLLIISCLCFLVGCDDVVLNDDVADKEAINTKEEKINYGIFSDYYDLALNKLNSLSVEEKVGQIIFSRMPSSDVDRAVKDYHVGGFVLFGVDFKNKTKGQVINEIKSYQDSASIPLLLGVDEEGGSVVRISSNSNLYSHRFDSPMNIYNKDGMDGIINDTEEKSKLLKELGLNVNLAPVADVSTHKNDFIYDRTLGRGAEEVSEYIKNVVKIYNENNIGSCLKHFPGYGNNVDTHTGISIDRRDYSEFESNDFLPFKAGIEEGVPSILVSHNIVNCMDKDKPASISIKVHKILRDDLGFTGVIITDDLAMDGVKNYSDNVYVEAVKAGNDLLITSYYEKTYNDIMDALNNNEIDIETINNSVLRVIAFKYSLGLLKE